LRIGFEVVSDEKQKRVEMPASVYPSSRVRDDMDDETWHRIRDQEERQRNERRG
jgi:S-methylmethionine-dependent homocysteine/selenocysteine methylase